MYSVKDVVDMLKNRSENQFDNILAITGNRGIGKSDFGLNICIRTKPFRLNKQITFKREDLMNLMNSSKKLFIIADEMINVAHNREFFNNEQLQLIKFINMYRDNCNSLVFCIKNFWHLDNQLRDLVSMRIHIRRRGLGELHLPHDTTFGTDKWDSKKNEKIESQWLKNKIVKPKMNKISTFKGYVKFRPIPKSIRLRYDKIKAKKRNIVFTEMGTDVKPRMDIMEVFNAPEEKQFELSQQYAKERNSTLMSVFRELQEIRRYKKRVVNNPFEYKNKSKETIKNVPIPI